MTKSPKISIPPPVNMTSQVSKVNKPAKPLKIPNLADYLELEGSLLSDNASLAVDKKF